LTSPVFTFHLATFLRVANKGWHRYWDSRLLELNHFNPAPSLWPEPYSPFNPPHFFLYKSQPCQSSDVTVAATASTKSLEPDDPVDEPTLDEFSLREYHTASTPSGMFRNQVRREEMRIMETLISSSRMSSNERPPYEAANLSPEIAANRVRTRWIEQGIWKENGARLGVAGLSRTAFG
jgi:hypothetical protein